MEHARIRSGRWHLIAVIVAVGVFMTGCSSSGTSASATPHVSASSTAGGTAGTTAGATAPGASQSPTGTVAIRTGPDGPYLVDGAGVALYLFALDAGSTSSCTGDCAQAWPPYTTTAPLTAGPGASATLSTTAQPGGVQQVTYNGHLLYHFAKDPAPGSITGEGANNVWYLLSPTGDAIKKSS